MSETKIPVISLMLNGNGGGMIFEQESLGAVAAELEDFLLNGDSDDFYTVKRDTMTREQLDKLPEFQGW